MAITLTLLTATPTVVPWSLISVTLFSVFISWLWAKRNYWQFIEKGYAAKKAKSAAKNEPYSVVSNRQSAEVASIKWHRFQWYVLVATFLYPVICQHLNIAHQWQDLFLGMFTFWIAFDGFLNKLNGNDMLYLGGGWWDGLFKEIPNGRYWMLVVKAICIILSWWAYALPGNIFHLFNSPAV